MDQFLSGLLNGIIVILIASGIGLIIGATSAIGYNYFHNKTKKVCDLCFREIKKVNELYNKNK